MFHNLIGNAVDATAGEGRTPEITIRTHALEAGGSASALRVEIEDNGSGFPESILAKAFEPYITTKPTGTGLGLPMVKKIAEEHRAKVLLENRTGADGTVQGARVTIVFPCL
jgi:nitrogen fixation/metabolism regulation signal transduction histidine kinase